MADVADVVGVLARLHGEVPDVEHPAVVHGAYCSGRRAAAEVAGALGTT